jgi:hypothetical protein
MQSAALNPTDAASSALTNRAEAGLKGLHNWVKVSESRCFLLERARQIETKRTGLSREVDNTTLDEVV